MLGRVVEAEVRVGPPDRRRPAVTVVVTEVLKGSLSPGPLRFLQHGHGVATFRTGEEVLLFLRRTENVAELADPRLAEAAPWTSLQEHDDRFPLNGAHRQPTLAAARRYVALARLPRDDQADALRALTVDLLLGVDTRLAELALPDLAVSAVVPKLTDEDVTRLARRIDDAGASIGLRVGLLVELSRRGHLEAGPRWVRLLQATEGGDLVAACRAAGRHPSPPVTAELIRILQGGGAAAPAAARALGGPAHRSAVTALAAALDADDPSLRHAAIRALGQIGDRSARAPLERAAASHPDLATRRRARAELTARFAP